MSNDPKAFPQADHVPIIGRPMSMNGGFVTMSITCRCEAMQPLLLVGFGAIATCPHCGKGWRLMAYAHDSRTSSSPEVAIDCVLKAPPAVKPS